MVFAVALFVAEIKIVSHGILTAGGVAALLLGTIILFPPLRPTFPGVRANVDPLVIAVVVGLSAAFFFVVARLALRARYLPVASGTGLLVGAIGIAKSDIGPTGIAHVGGDDWSVVNEGAPIPKGGSVRVKRVDSIRLIVEPARESAERRAGS
jgi:membrane-bound serine protease (ClpP class)